ncbi:hypothetical protein HanRHA438_Chr14g0680991 [Helianthus annuus]|nr:hypothetical protein HanRHA438_Chr14g0680991 [Helianthus annuus]
MIRFSAFCILFAKLSIHFFHRNRDFQKFGGFLHIKELQKNKRESRKTPQIFISKMKMSFLQIIHV